MVIRIVVMLMGTMMVVVLEMEVIRVFMMVVMMGMMMTVSNIY